MALTIQVFRTAGYNCTNGASAVVDQITVNNVSGPDKANRMPGYLLEKSKAGVLRLIPDCADAAGKGAPWFMFGGNYGATSDSRFSEACERILGAKFYGAVAIHDRVE